MISYSSTRDAQKQAVSFADALLKGLAPDGGLYIPSGFPQVPQDAWRKASSIADVALAVLGAWTHDDIPMAAIEPLVYDAFNFEVPTVKLSNDLFVLELIHGPTHSFKDFGARSMARLMNYFLQQRGERRTILVATSGDTGSAVADGFSGLDNIDVILLYPKGMVSNVQERQLITQRKGVQSFAVEGTFDDCQRMVKEAFVSPHLAHLPLSSANSINMGRLLPQSVYYLWSIAQTQLDKVNICVPSGNLGNICGAMLASAVGQPINRFIAGHNANHFFPDFLAGISEAYAFNPTVATVSNAMDVGAPSNFERLYHMFGPEHLKERVWATSIDDASTLERMKAIYDQYNYVACPHTSVGLEAVYRYRKATQDHTPTITLSCAHPAKFPESISATLGIKTPTLEALEVLTTKPSKVTSIAPTLEALIQASALA